MNINDLLSVCVQNQASDLHLSAGEKPRMRIDGDIRLIQSDRLEHQQIQQLLFPLMDDLQRQQWDNKNDIDFSFSLPDLGRFRANVFQQQRGMAAVFRLIPTDIPQLEAINSPRVFKQIAEQQRGLVLVTGPTGSGKSTTLAAMVEYRNQKDYAHILTIEDPIEWVYQSQRCLINQREVNRDTPSFQQALRSALREDPDIILLGEMRDLETIRLALTAAETGHLVLATVHTTSAAKTIDRIISVFPAEEKKVMRSMLSESLQAVISQSLVKKKGGGRIAAYEILLATTAVRHLIREDKVPHIYSAMQTGSAAGMQTLDQELQVLYKQGLVTKEEALFWALNKQMF